MVNEQIYDRVIFPELRLWKTSIKTVFAFFKENYPDVLELYTSAEVDNMTAIELYKKAGFKEGNIFEYEAAGIQYKEIRMMLSLQNQE